MDGCKIGNKKSKTTAMEVDEDMVQKNECSVGYNTSVQYSKLADSSLEIGGFAVCMQYVLSQSP